MTNPYLDLTADFNRGRLRALLSSGQAVVVYRLAIMSKDGDWVLREDAESLTHVLQVLSGIGATYRFGAPLDLRWLEGGWSSHFEARRAGLRLRTDFVSRPPRVSAEQLARMWSVAEMEGRTVVGLEPLLEMKLTQREKDYAVVGELARLLDEPTQLLYSRSARDLIELAERHPERLAEATPRRPLLGLVEQGRDRLEEALDRERRALMRSDEERLDRYQRASEAWGRRWPDLEREIAGLTLVEAHARVVDAARGVLPVTPLGAA